MSLQPTTASQIDLGSPTPTASRNLRRRETLAVPSPGFVFQSPDSRRAVTRPANNSQSPGSTPDKMSSILEEESDTDQSDESDISDDSILVQAQPRYSKSSKSKKSVVLKKVQSSGKRESKNKVQSKTTVPAKKRKHLPVEVSQYFNFIFIVSTFL
ncbi:uncharacterized protein MELLADRAFT_67851 [Melampsora larici-populina 98AG31]|uniref:Uncharacterized protein n=1 Tax=Melampsora larici-populina (strain 98AG31 / pathotype 3-4-7) TaxID=747676 RepID=F4S4P2_MELLP|nr:uncharacterized protein MELLADRAFT_67851 [Melampsora larici-populina 98AG31]EGG00393.1 hypothetical protein MELLADRAFT_67851 [Melampsora larici-populina 98AG31]